jgi:hypothetical protein
MRDVIFDEMMFFNGKRTDLLDEFIAEMDILIERIKLPELQVRNEALLKKDEEVLELAVGVETDDNDEPI